MDHHGSVRRLWEVFAFAQQSRGVSNWTLFTFASIGGIAGGSTAYILPWFPNMCKEKGLSRFETGLIFAIFDLVIICTRWPMIKLAKSRGHRWLFLLGYLIQAASLFCLGFINHIENVGFLMMGLVFRGCQGLGAAMVSAAALQVMNALAYCNVGMVGKITEALVGLFRVFGALLGAGLFHAFGSGDMGLKIAFWVLVGITGTMSILATAMKIPVDPRTVPIREREPGENTPLTEMLGNRTVVLTLLLLFMVDFVSTALEPTLSIHMYEVYQMDAWERGAVFAEMGLFGIIATPLASWLAECNRWCLHRKMFCLIGVFLTALCVVGLGFGSSSGYANLFMCLLGVSLALVAVPAVPAMIWDIPDTSDLTDGEISRVMNNVAAVAAVLGPLWGGGIAQAGGFKIMSGVTSATITIGGSVLAFMYGCKYMDWKNPPQVDEDGDEVVPILQRQNEVKRPHVEPEEPLLDMILGWFGAGPKTKGKETETAVENPVGDADTSLQSSQFTTAPVASQGPGAVSSTLPTAFPANPFPQSSTAS